MRRAFLVLLLGIGACGGDRHEPEPPSPVDPTQPFPDPVTSSDAVGSGGFSTTGPVMENEPARIAESGDGTTGAGATTGTIVGVTGTVSTTGTATGQTASTSTTTSTTGRSASLR